MGTALGIGLTTPGAVRGGGLGFGAGGTDCPDSGRRARHNRINPAQITESLNRCTRWNGIRARANSKDSFSMSEGVHIRKPTLASRLVITIGETAISIVF